MKKYIPDFLTCMNLFCGCLALVYLFNGNFTGASFMVFIAMIFDFFDGMAARFLNVSSPIGKDLDSLADMVSFGVVPGMMLYEMIKYSLDASEGEYTVFFSIFLLTLPFLVPICSALRLAKFNTDIRQKNSFIGLPTPASTMLIVSLPLIGSFDDNALVNFIHNPIVLVIIGCAVSYLMISPIPMMSLKFTNFALKGNIARYLILLFAIPLIWIFHFTAVPIILVLYISLSLIEITKSKSKTDSQST